MAEKKPWHLQTPHEALTTQGATLDEGISHDVAARRRAEFGINTIESATRKRPWSILLSQFSDLLIAVLIVAALIAGFLGEPQDTIAILAIVILNAALGFYQEYRAERAMEALQALAAPHAKIRRMGEVMVVPAYELVPGDIVLLEAGNIVPADLRILEAFQFQTDEAALTGESLPVLKKSEPLAQGEWTVADQKNMAFKGTLVAAGRATGLVVRTGMTTELGRVANLLKEEVEVKTPLQKRIAAFAKKLALVVIALCVVIFVVGLARGEEPVLMFLTALSLAVAGIPEALPAVVTVALALGTRTMIRRNALVRKLPAVEALGSVTVICSDKTGTLTENKMSVQDTHITGDWTLFYRILALSNDVTFGSKGVLQGDPTETALVQAALEEGQDKRALTSEFPRIAEIPFSSERGMMSTLHGTLNRGWIFTKGAPEKLLPLCNGPIGAEATAKAMAAQGHRVLAIACRQFDSRLSTIDLETIEKDMTFVGLVGLMDPPRAEVAESIRLCHNAGIRAVMITGDHPETAKAIAQRLGIMKHGDGDVLTGLQLAQTTDHALKELVAKTTVYARVAPEQKIRIVKALQEAGEIVAMTGDGVNDAPALRRSDVGVSMGKGGTDVAREASHVILLDDNFATIVSAIREGRCIYDNIRKFIRFALSGNSGEIWTLFLAPFVGLPTPLLPIHILWVNLVTDGLPGLALALEPEEKNVMGRPPRPPQESVFAHGLGHHTIMVGILTAGATLSVMAWAYYTQQAHWQSMAFTVLTLVQMGHVMAIRSETESLFTLGLRSNMALLGAVIVTFALQLAVLYVPTFNRLFKTQPLSGGELMICLAASSVVFIAVELEKLYRRQRITIPST